MFKWILNTQIKLFLKDSIYTIILLAFLYPSSSSQLVLKYLMSDVRASDKIAYQEKLLFLHENIWAQLFKASLA